MKIVSLTILSLAVFMSACADPAANKPKAGANTPVTAAAPSGEPADANVLASFNAAETELTLTPENSKIEFTGSKVTGKHDGGFKRFKGVIDLVGDKPETSRVAFEIEMKSIFTDTDGVTKHLQTPDFFDVEKFPKAAFISTLIAAPAGGGPGNYTVTGDMIIHGVKKSITFPSSITVTPEAVGVAAEFSINRKDFGVAYAGKADDLIRDDVVLRLELKAARKK